jgi:hypothetical protein
VPLIRRFLGHFEEVPQKIATFGGTLIKIPLKMDTFGAFSHVPQKMATFRALSDVPQKMATWDIFRYALKVSVHILHRTNII